MSERKRPGHAPSAEAATPSQHGELVLYSTGDGSARFYLRAEHGTAWLSQLELAELFQTSVPNINIHIKNVLAEGELQSEATIKDDLIVRTEGIASMFLDYGEDRASQRQNLRMEDWRQYVDRFVEFNERPLLKGAGKTSHERMQQVAHERYNEFDAKRRQAEAMAADAEDIRELECVEKAYKEKEPQR